MDPHHSSVLPKVTVPQAFGIIVCQPVMVLFVAEYIFAPFYLLLHLFLQYVLSITFFSLQPLLVHLFLSQNMDKRLDALILYGSLMIPIVVLHAKLATVCLVPLSGGVYKTAHGVELHHHVKVRSLKVHMLKKQDILCPQDELFFLRSPMSTFFDRLALRLTV